MIALDNGMWQKTRGVAIQVIRTIGLTILFTSIVVLVSTSRYGSLSSAMAAARGETVYVSNIKQDFGVQRIGANVLIKVQIYNISSKPLTIQGSETSCSCTVIENLPIVIEKRSSIELQASVKMPDDPMEVKGTFTLYTDDESKPRIIIMYSGIASVTLP